MYVSSIDFGNPFSKENFRSKKMTVTVAVTFIPAVG